MTSFQSDLPVPGIELRAAECPSMCASSHGAEAPSKVTMPICVLGLILPRPQEHCEEVVPTNLANKQDGQLAQMEDLVDRAAHHETSEIADPSAAHDDHGSPTFLRLVEDLESDKGGERRPDDPGRFDAGAHQVGHDPVD